MTPNAIRLRLHPYSLLAPPDELRFRISEARFPLREEGLNKRKRVRNYTDLSRESFEIFNATKLDQSQILGTLCRRKFINIIVIIQIIVCIKIITSICYYKIVIEIAFLIELFTSGTIQSYIRELYLRTLG